MKVRKLLVHAIGGILVHESSQTTYHTEIQLPTLYFLSSVETEEFVYCSSDSCIGSASSIFSLCHRDRTNSFPLLLIAAGRVVPTVMYATDHGTVRPLDKTIAQSVAAFCGQGWTRLGLRLDELHPLRR